MSALTFPLFATNVGSHMWSMDTPTSDYDVADIYVVDTAHLLDGRPYRRVLPQQLGIVYESVPNCDVTSQEIGHLVDKLIGGNCNAIWTVMSPIVVRDHLQLDRLRTIVQENLAQNVFNSVNGIAHSHLFSRSKSSTSKMNADEKSLQSALRVINFGITLFDTGRVEFKPAPTDATRADAVSLLHDLRSSWESSTLPPAPDESAYRRYLYDLRIGYVTARIGT